MMWLTFHSSKALTGSKSVFLNNGWAKCQIRDKPLAEPMSRQFAKRFFVSSGFTSQIIRIRNIPYELV